MSSTSFASLGLSRVVLEALADAEYAVPTPIQQQAIAPALAGKDLLGIAQTGTGKTAAFALPVLHLLDAQPIDKTRRGPRRPRALVLCPTRELATQIGESFETYGKHSMLTGTVIFGGVSQFHQVKALQRGIDILVATPGRLIDLIEQRLVDLSQVQILILDEADRMLDMGFIAPIRKIAALLPTTRQTMLFSATMPREISRLAESLLRDPVRVAVTPVASAVPAIAQSVYLVQRDRKQPLLERLLQDPAVTRAVVFTRTKHGADRVCRRLVRAGITAEAIHGNKAQNQRTRALDAFRAGRSRVLVATDVAARGLDVDGISHVFNYELPNEPEAYVHRIGRTGRAGATGIAIGFCDGEERGFLRDIERLTGKRLNILPVPTDLPAPVRDEPPARPAAHHSGGPGAGSSSARRPRDPHAQRAHPGQPSHPHTPHGARASHSSGPPGAHPSSRPAPKGWNRPRGRSAGR